MGVDTPEDLGGVKTVTTDIDGWKHKSCRPAKQPVKALRDESHGLCKHRYIELFTLQLFTFILTFFTTNC